MYDKVILRDILLDEKFRVLDNNGKQYPPSSEIYLRIAECMAARGSSISAKHVYMIVKDDRNGYKTMLEKQYPIKKNDDFNSSIDLNYSTGDISTSTCLEDSSTDHPISKKMNVVLSAENWSAIKPERKLYNGRFYWKLKTGWTDMIADRLWQQHQLYCVFAFKNNIVHPTGNSEYYALLHGVCVECKAKLTGTIKQEPVPDTDIILFCEIENIRVNAHSGNTRRQLKGQRREKVASDLIEKRKDAIVFIREEAKRLKTFGQMDPPILPKTSVLRKAKEEQILKNYGLHFANPALNLLQHSKYGKYAGSIHNIGILKFYCIYWTKEQQQIYVARCKEDENAILTIDATGSIAKNVSKSDPHIFLYQCVLVSKKGSVPVFQMVSADQRALQIAYFLKTILSKNMPTPPIVVTDFSRALLLAVAETFAKCKDLRDYLQKCYRNIVHKDSELLECFIRLDVSHLISMVGRWKCFKGKNPAVRRFYLRCVGQAYQMRDYNELKYFLESVMIVALSAFIEFGANQGTEQPKFRMNFINKIIEGIVPFDEDIEEQIDNPDEEEIVVDFLETNWVTWTESLYDTANEVANKAKEGTIINACFNPEFVEKIRKQLLPYLPIWTGIMIPHFKKGNSIATSASVESEFRDLKHRSFKGQLPMRIDKFVLQHLNHLDGKIKLASTKGDAMAVQDRNDSKTDLFIADDLQNDTLNFEQEHNNTSIISTSKESISKQTVNSQWQEFTDWNACENWRNKIKSDEVDSEAPKEKRKKPTYLDKCPEWELIKDCNFNAIPMFKNGSFTSKVTIDSSEINVTQTCAFDSLFQIILSGISTNKKYYDQVMSSSSPIIQLALTVLKDKKIARKHYNERANILLHLPLFKNSISTYTRRIQKLDAECNVSHLADYLFSTDPSCVKKFLCSCGNHSERLIVTISINVDILICQGLEFIEEALKDANSPRRLCRKCNAFSEEEVAYGSQILIDTSILTDERYVQLYKKVHHTLGALATRIRLGSKTFTITGVVDYKPGHYIAYTKTGAYWHKYDDICVKRESVSSQTEIKPHLVIYTLEKSN